MRKLLFLVIITAAALLSYTKQDISPTPKVSGKSGIDTAVTIAGDVYPVVQIGSQSWTSVNYRGPGGIYNTGYNEEGGLMHGKLYAPPEASQIVLPTGWRIPSHDDYLALLIVRGATKNSDGSYSVTLAVAESLMSKSGWEERGGNNYSGFSALPTGFYHLSSYFGTGNGASFLHTLVVGSAPDQAFMIGRGPTGQPLILLGISLFDDDRCSVRFVKDNSPSK
jgi:uncharacterized protein (TIGR02145 family)